jgi:hypothetical protein
MGGKRAKGALDRAIAAIGPASTPEVNVWIGPTGSTSLAKGAPHRRERRLRHPPHPRRVRGGPARDARLELAGYEVVRFTDRQLREEPERVAATLRALLLRAGAQPIRP